MELNELTKPRLTDDRTYQQVKDVAEGHARAGRTPDIDQLRYIKLAECERAENYISDDIKMALYGLKVFLHHWCMNVQKTNENDEPCFRCKECKFRWYDGHGRCLVKMFANEFKDEKPDNFDSMSR